MTESEAVEQAIGSLKAHGGSRMELVDRIRALHRAPYLAREVVKTCAELVREHGHPKCADGLLKLEWVDDPA